MNIIDRYLKQIVHLKSATKYVNDIVIIEESLVNFSYEDAEDTISYIAIKYRKDLNTIGRMLTGVMVLSPKEVGEKTPEEVYDDLLYLRDCVIVFAAVHCGLEKTIKDVVIKINNQIN